MERSVIKKQFKKENNKFFEERQNKVICLNIYIYIYKSKYKKVGILPIRIV